MQAKSITRAVKYATVWYRVRFRVFRSISTYASCKRQCGPIFLHTRIAYIMYQPFSAYRVWRIVYRVSQTAKGSFFYEKK